MTPIFKAACLLTGADYHRALHAPSPSRVKIGALALAIAVPTLIWIASTYLLVTRVLQLATGAGLMAALFSGTIILILETLIVKATGNFWISLFRVVLGLCAAAIGAVIIDEIVFAADVDQQMELLRTERSVQAGNRAAAQYAALYQMDALDLDIMLAQKHYKALDSLARGEADGTIGSGHRGVDVVTRLKQQQANTARMEFENLVNKKKTHLLQQAQAHSLAYAKAEKAFNPNSLLMRIKALFRLVMEEEAMLAIYAIFTLMMFVLEFLVIILKLCWKKTALETESDALEQLHKERTGRHLNPGSPLTDPIHTPHLARLFTGHQHFNTLL